MRGTHVQLPLRMSAARLPFTFQRSPAIVARMWRGILLLGFTGLFFGGCASRHSDSAPTAPAPYVRVSEPSPGVVQLEIAVRRFTPRRASGPSIWLTAVSHLGDPDYYRALQAHLDARTLVLFEGVGGEARPRGPRAANAPAAGGETSLQSRMAQALGLAFQLEAIDYDRAHFQNSDLTVAELRALMSPPATTTNGASISARAEAARSFEQVMQAMQGESFFGRLMNLGLRWLGTQPRYSALAKFTLVEMLAAVQGDLESLGALPPGLRELLRVLIDERNQRVLADVRRELPRLGARDSLSVFYGAGHMSDLETRLRRELRYEVREEIWFPAMTVNTRAAGLTAAELVATRAAIQQQVQMLRSRVPRSP